MTIFGNTCTLQENKANFGLGCEKLIREYNIGKFGQSMLAQGCDINIPEA